MPALSIDNVSFSYHSSTPTLLNVSFDVQKGEFLSLVGPNGSGKTTLLRLLDRILLPRKGSIILDGKDITAYPRAELARKVASVPQDTNIQFPFTALEIVLMGRSPHNRGAMFENEHDIALALEMLKTTDTQHLAGQPITTLSGGERQRVFIARALAQQPEILLMDEPNAHLDIAHQLEVFNIIRRLNRERGLTVVSVSHDLNLASTYSDRIGMLVCGSLAAIGTPNDVLTEETIARVFRTEVLVDQHPTAHSPRVTLVTSNE